MEWSLEGTSMLYELNYSDGKLIVQKEGFYYVYSKLSYSADCRSFVQMVRKTTPRYMGEHPPLLTYRRHNSNSVHKDTLRNTYLGGVFHLFEGDAVFVEVSNGSLIRLRNTADNFFGMFML